MRIMDDFEEIALHVRKTFVINSLQTENEIYKVLPMTWAQPEKHDLILELVNMGMIELAPPTYRLTSEQIEPTINEMEEELIKNGI